MLTLVLILLAVFVVLWLIPAKGSSSKGVSLASFVPTQSVSLFGQQLDEEAEMLATAYRSKAKAAREAEVIEKASNLLSK